jgi:hypothetical protein
VAAWQHEQPAVPTAPLSNGSSDRIATAVRGLTLPLDPSLEAAAIRAISESLTGAGVAAEEQADFMNARYSAWRQTGQRNPVFEQAVIAGLRAGDSKWGEAFAESYFRVHEEILQRKHLCSFDQATTLLSHMRLVLLLVQQDKMTAAQAAKLLRVRDRRVNVGWRAIKDVLAAMGVRIRIEEEDAQALFVVDKQQEEIVFADAGFEDAALIVDSLANDLGFGNGLYDLLLRVFPADPSGDRHAPYLQILHQVLVTAEYFDHAIKHIYEFAPRGLLGSLVHDAYPTHLRAAGSAVLNNAKSVDALDDGWARSKEDHLAGATALYEIIDRLEDMPYLARRELAARLRQWLFRIIRLMAPLTTRVPSPASTADVTAITSAVGTNQTGTYGIIEQRLTDAVAAEIYPASAGWRHHGIGDSVNATNASRKKVGDCEFQRPKEIVAFEAHAGRLSNVYVDGHVEGLRRVVAMRKYEWGRIAAPSDWQITIRFLAHGALPAPRTEVVDGFTIQCLFENYSSFLAAGPAPPQLMASFEQHVVARLNESGTPDTVRRRYLDLTGH